MISALKSVSSLFTVGFLLYTSVAAATENCRRGDTKISHASPRRWKTQRRGDTRNSSSFAEEMKNQRQGEAFANEHF